MQKDAPRQGLALHGFGMVHDSGVPLHNPLLRQVRELWPLDTVGERQVSWQTDPTKVLAHDTTAPNAGSGIASHVTVHMLLFNEYPAGHVHTHSPLTHVALTASGSGLEQATPSSAPAVQASAGARRDAAQRSNTNMSRGLCGLCGLVDKVSAYVSRVSQLRRDKKTEAGNRETALCEK